MKGRRATVLVAAGLLLACTRRGVSAQPEKPGAEGQAAVVAALVRADNGFGFELFQRLLEQDWDRNVFISPTSIAMALAMAWNGAEGQTRTDMAGVLRLSGLAPGDVSATNRALLAGLKSADPKVQLEIANSLWARKGIPLAPRFIKANQDYYEAQVAELDFSSPQAPGVINNWVKQKTRDKIERIVGSIDPLDVLFLINAVYFKGKWTRQFDKGVTAEQEFYRADGTVKQHPMMRQRGEYRYYQGEGFQAVELPYGEERISMLVFLPVRREPEEPTRDEKGNVTRAFLARAVSDLAARLTPEDWQRWQDSMRTRKGDVVLPRFRLEYEQTLNRMLGAMGMSVAFDPKRADFSGMLGAGIDMPFYISEVKHKSFVEVNEEGTEAAAVTSVKMTMTAMPQPEETFTMVCDRPFLYAIRDAETGAVLFLGAVFDPQ